MRYLLITLVLLLKTVQGQEIVLFDGNTNERLQGVAVSLNNYNSSQIFFSDSLGVVNIAHFKNSDTLIFEQVGYKALKVSKKNIRLNKVYLELKAYTLENINISESRVKKLSFIKTKRPKIISSQSSQIGEILEKNMGISVQHSQNGGGSINLKGMEANRLLIIVDGIALNNTIFRSGRSQSSSIINPFFLDEIDILSGPASVAYGNSAMSGAIVLNTKKPSQKNSVEIMQQYESSSKAVYTTILSNLKQKRSSHIIGLSIKSYQDLMMGKNRLHGFENWGNERIITKNNLQKKTSYNQADFLFKSLYKIHKTMFLITNTQISTSSNINRFDKLNDLSGDILKYKNWYYGPRNRMFQSFRIKNYLSNILYDESVYTVGLQKIEESRHKQKNTDAFLSIRKENLNILDLTSSYSKKISILELDYGIDFRYQKLNSSANLFSNDTYFFNTTRYPDGGTSVINNGIYASGTFRVSKKIIMQSGLRYNINKLSAKFEDTSIVMLPFTQINVSNKSLLASLKATCYLDKNISLDISLSNGFRNPNTDDVGKLFSKNDNDVIVPNNMLKPEKSINIETTLRVKLQNKLSVNAQLYRTHLKDVITRKEAQLNGLDSIWYDGELMKVIMNKNINSAVINGLCLAYSFKINKKFSHKSVCNIIKGVTNEKTPLSHIPPANINSELIYNIKKYSLNLNVHYNALKKVSEYSTSGTDNLEEATHIGNPSWFTINFKTKINLDKNIIFIFGINNIMDIHYKTFGSGLSSSGRNFTLSLFTKF